MVFVGVVVVVRVRLRDHTYYCSIYSIMLLFPAQYVVLVVVGFRFEARGCVVLCWGFRDTTWVQFISIGINRVLVMFSLGYCHATHHCVDWIGLDWIGLDWIGLDWKAG